MEALQCILQPKVHNPSKVKCMVLIPTITQSPSCHDYSKSVLPSTSTGASKSGWRLDTLHPKGFCEAWPFEVGPYPHCVQ